MGQIDLGHFVTPVPVVITKLGGVAVWWCSSGTLRSPRRRVGEGVVENGFSGHHRRGAATDRVGVQAVLFLMLVALIQSVPLSAGAQTLGEMFQGVADNLGTTNNGPVSGLLMIIAYIAGIGFGISGILKLRAHVDSPQQVPLGVPLRRLLAAGLLIAIPYFITALIATLNAGDGGLDRVALGEGGSGEGLDILFANFMRNASGPAFTLIGVCCFLTGIALAISGVIRLTKQDQEGPRGPSGAGTLMTFVTAAILIAIPQIMDLMSNTLFGGARDVQPILAYGSSSSGELQRTAQRTMEAVFLFVQLIGWLAFIRGFMVLRKMADGDQQSTMTQGFVFIFGGALAANLAPFVRAVQNTVGLPGKLIN